MDTLKIEGFVEGFVVSLNCGLILYDTDKDDLIRVKTFVFYMY